MKKFIFCFLVRSQGCLWFSIATSGLQKAHVPAEVGWVSVSGRDLEVVEDWGTRAQHLQACAMRAATPSLSLRSDFLSFENILMKGAVCLS